MQCHRYSTALSHIILVGTSIYCLKSYGIRDWKRFPLGAYGIILTNSLLGVWYWGNPDHGSKLEKPFKFQTFLQRTLVLPLIASDIWLRSGFPREIAYAHALLSLIPLLQYLLHRIQFTVIDVIAAVNIISLSFVAFVTENYFGVAAAVSFCMNHFLLAKEQDFLDAPPEDVYNYGLCFFAYFALRTVTN